MKLKKIWNILTKGTRRKRAFFFLVGDTLIISFCVLASFLLRFEGKISIAEAHHLWKFLILATIVKITFLYFHKLYHVSWSYVSLREIIAIAKSSVYSLFILMTVVLIGRERNPFYNSPLGFPRSVLFLDFLLSFLSISLFRFSKRLFIHFSRELPVEGEKTLIVGAGNAGEQVLRIILQERAPTHRPVGFIDDDESKINTTIHGIKVLGKREDILYFVNAYNIENVIIAMPSSPRKVIQEIVMLCRQAKVKNISIIPPLSEVYSGRLTQQDIRRVQFEDIFQRPEIKINSERVSSFINGKIILVTGAGGSIGSELCYQIAKFKPRKLIMLDQDETNLFYTENRLSSFLPVENVQLRIGNILDERKLELLFSELRPEMVFHAAAYKHVHLMEKQPEEATKVNIFGTFNVARLSQKYKTGKFVLISTDKAVNPVSVMGVTKRIAEIVIRELNSNGNTKFLAVRFGNVFGSRGSVLEIFKERIAKRESLSITHPEMKRYFMSISEAVLLILEAAATSEGGEVYLLDMGEPVKIVDLAKELIKFYNLEPEVDISIIFTGLRPGEKLFEDIMTAEEGIEATKDANLFVAKMNYSAKGSNFWSKLKELEQILQKDNAIVNDFTNIFREIVPSYKPWGKN
ncbi:MAG TPA: hypothetical protein DHV62_00420 [Elusimicrobia bacterium]|jgi:FlaA1/EpsC-like NDP-sugar epimerase|nr:hypothetical protein [Elusimicrobiota bacterium]